MVIDLKDQLATDSTTFLSKGTERRMLRVRDAVSRKCG